MTSRLRAGNKKFSVVVTAGPTREKIDPIRYISNYSTGTFGYEIAALAVRRGFRVTLISGPTCLEAPRGLRLINVESALQMKAAVDRAVKGADCLIMAAAVSDWRVPRPVNGKIKRGSGRMTLELVENPDIVASLGTRNNGGLILAGFALETENLEKNAVKKLKEKGLDLIVANACKPGAAPFGDNITDIILIDRFGGRDRIRRKTKAEAAKIILDRVFALKI